MNKKSSYNNQLQQAKSLYNQGLLQDALTAYETLIKAYPEEAKPVAGAGACLFAMEEKTQALGCFIKASKLEPGNAEHFVNIGNCLRASGQDRLAISQYEEAISIDPNNFLALSQLGTLYLDRNRYTEAIDALEKAISIKASNSSNHAHLAMALAFVGNHEKAIKHADKAIRLSRNDAFSNFIRGAISIISGNLNEADKFLNKAIEINPHYGTAYQARTTKKITEKDQPLIDKMEKTLDQGMPSNDRKLILYALGKSYNDLQKPDKAFEYIRKANELSNPMFYPKVYSKKMRNLKQYFNKNFFNQMKFHTDIDYTPIFIVGMPRSGSTLLDQILSAHSSVFSGGESSALPDTINEIKDDVDNEIGFPHCLDKLNQSKAEKYSNAYIHKIASDAKSVTHIVDKNLFNYERLGLIAILFPNAKIIHARRHPLDTALSCYLNGFSDSGMDWTNNFEWIGKFYLDYIKLMDHWHTTLPLPILDIQYEDVIDNPERNVRTILDFCGLEWEDACLNFHQSKRSVSTASVWQVRQPLYKTSVQRWVPYAKHLQPLVLALGDVLEADYEKLESLGLKHGPRHNSPLNKISKLFK